MVPQLIHIHSILAPTDFSPASKKGIQYAAAFARQFEARISLIHVYELPFYAADLSFTPITSKLEKLAEATSRKRLEELAGEFIPENIKGQLLWRAGKPFEQICRIARELSSDLIILNTHGYTGLKHVLMGSTPERVVRHAPCPVLSVCVSEHEFN